MDKLLLTFYCTFFLFFNSCSTATKSETSSKILQIENKEEDKTELNPPEISNPKPYHEYVSDFISSSFELHPVIENKLFFSRGESPIEDSFTFKEHPELMETLNLRLGNKISWLDFESGVLSVYTIHENSKFIKQKDFNQGGAGIYLALIDDKNKVMFDPEDKHRIINFFSGLAHLDLENSHSPLQSSHINPLNWKEISKYRYFNDEDINSKLTNSDPFYRTLTIQTQFKNIEIIKVAWRASPPRTNDNNLAGGLYFNYLNALHPLRELGPLNPREYSSNFLWDLKVGNFINEAEASFIYQDAEMYTCGGVLIFYRDRIEHVRFNCDPEGC